VISWETTEPVYRLALDWIDGADGMPVCLDDGSAYDTVEATITGRLLPDELSDLHDAWQGSRLYAMTSTGYLLGPEIDMSAGVTVTLLDVKVDGPSDSSCTLYDVTIVVGYALSMAITANELGFAFASGVPYHESRPTTVAQMFDGGSYGVATTGAAIARRCTWYISGLTQPYANAICRELRYLRGSQYAWDTVGVEEPFGPGGGTSSFVRIPGWRVIAESNLTWGLEINVVQEALSAVGDYMIGYDGSTTDYMVGDTGQMVGV